MAICRPGRAASGILAVALAIAATSSASELEDDVVFLSSERLGGRLTGSDGIRRAADYLATRLRSIGAVPLPGLDDILVPFEFTAGVRDAGSFLALEPQAAEGRVWRSGDDLRALSFSDSGTVRGEVVFAGYGLQIPENENYPYNSYSGLDVDGKIVVVLRYFPEDADQESRTILARYSGLRYKALYAREHGAKALLVLTGPRSPNAAELVPMTFDTAIAGSGVVAASISGAVGEELFGFASQSLADVQASLDTANPHVTGFAIPGVEMQLQVEVEREKRVGQNVVAYFPATSSTLVEATSSTSGAKPWLVLGAHYDHLGEGRGGNSLARRDEAGSIHPGADDNASGVAGMLAVAGRLAAQPQRDRAVAVAFWSGEELGLLGSSEFVAAAHLDAARIVAYLNFDMVGRMRDNKLVAQGVGSSPRWPALLEQSNIRVGFDLQIQQDPFLPTDSTSFNRVDVPTLNLFTGSHEDYHRPSDRPEKLNYEDLERVVRFTTILAAKLMRKDEALEFVKFEPPVQSIGRDGVRAFTGTIPDYTAEVAGLLLSGVVGGGPAEEAGLREGDLIIRFGSQEIANIYDYTYALDAVKIDEPLEIVFMRDGEEKTTTMTPRARP